MSGLRVAVLGDACVDLVVRLPERAGRPADLTHSVPELHGGGSGANTAVALARLGVPAAMLGTIGDDGYGRWEQADLMREGVDIQGLCARPDALTTMVLALIEPTGERLIVVWPPEGGAHLHLQMEHLEPASITGAAWLHTTGMCLRASPACETLLTAMALARQAGVPVSLDLNLRLEAWGLDAATRQAFERAIELADVVLGNAEEELRPLAEGSTVEAVARQLAGRQRTIVARLGSQGALAVTPEAAVHVPAFQTPVVDTLGAGDTFDAGFIAARLAGHSVVEAVRQGNAAAALKVGGLGARSSPVRQALDQLLATPRPGATPAPDAAPDHGTKPFRPGSH